MCSRALFRVRGKGQKVDAEVLTVVAGPFDSVTTQDKGGNMSIGIQGPDGKEQNGLSIEEKCRVMQSILYPYIDRFERMYGLHRVAGENHKEEKR